MRTSIIKACKRLLDSFNEITTPSEKYFSTEEEFELDHHRNKALLFIHGLCFLQFFTSIIIGKNELISNFQGLIWTASICAVLIISCRLSLHPQIFKGIYNLYLLPLGVSLTTHDMIGALFITLISPLLVYFLTGSLPHFMIHIVCKNILINIISQDLMKANLAETTADELVRTFTRFTNQNSVYFLVSILVIQYTIQKNFYGIYAAEKEIQQRNMEIPSEKIRIPLNIQTVPELRHNANNLSDPEKEIVKLKNGPKPLVSCSIIEAIWDICAEIIRENNLKGRMKVATNLPELLIFNDKRLIQIFLNLLREAVKCTKSGNVDITVEWVNDAAAVNDSCYELSSLNDSRNQEFVLLDFDRKMINKNLAQYTRRDKGILKISVDDNGREILKKDLPQPVSRSAHATVDQSNVILRTDQDLLITQALCHQINGDVRVFNQKGRSSTFVACLPVIQDRPVSFYCQDIKRVSMSRKLKVLVVDDATFHFITYKLFLNMMGIDAVEIAINDLEAYEKFVDHALRKDYFDFIMMDLYMPGMDGKTSSRKIREYEILNHLKPCPILITSVCPTEKQIKECMDKNGKIKAHQFIKKPPQIDDLYANILSIFEGKNPVSQ